MKKSILIFAITLISTCVFSQKIGIKLSSKQNVEAVPVQQAITVLTDTIGVESIVDNGSSVVVRLEIGKGLTERPRTLVLWDGQAYKDNQNWTNVTVIARIKVLLNLK